MAYVGNVPILNSPRTSPPRPPKPLQQVSARRARQSLEREKIREQERERELGMDEGTEIHKLRAELHILSIEKRAAERRLLGVPKKGNQVTDLEDKLTKALARVESLEAQLAGEVPHVSGTGSDSTSSEKDLQKQLKEALAERDVLRLQTDEIGMQLGSINAALAKAEGSNQHTSELLVAVRALEKHLSEKDELIQLLQDELASKVPQTLFDKRIISLQQSIHKQDEEKAWLLTECHKLSDELELEKDAREEVLAMSPKASELARINDKLRAANENLAKSSDEVALTEASNSELLELRSRIAEFDHQSQQVPILEQRVSELSQTVEDQAQQLLQALERESSFIEEINKLKVAEANTPATRSPQATYTASPPTPLTPIADDSALQKRIVELDGLVGRQAKQQQELQEELDKLRSERAEDSLGEEQCELSLSRHQVSDRSGQMQHKQDAKPHEASSQDVVTKEARSREMQIGSPSETTTPSLQEEKVKQLEDVIKAQNEQLQLLEAQNIMKETGAAERSHAVTQETHDKSMIEQQGGSYLRKPTSSDQSLQEEKVKQLEDVVEAQKEQLMLLEVQNKMKESGAAERSHTVTQETHDKSMIEQQGGSHLRKQTSSDQSLQEERIKQLEDVIETQKEQFASLERQYKKTEDSASQDVVSAHSHDTRENNEEHIKQLEGIIDSLQQRLSSEALSREATEQEQEQKVKELGEELKRKERRLSEVTKDDTAKRVVELGTLSETQAKLLEVANEREQQLQEELSSAQIGGSGKIKELESVIESQKRQLAVHDNARPGEQEQAHVTSPYLQQRLVELDGIVESQGRMLQEADEKECELQKEIEIGQQALRKAAELQAVIESQAKQLGNQPGQDVLRCKLAELDQLVEVKAKELAAQHGSLGDDAIKEHKEHVTTLETVIASQANQIRMLEGSDSVKKLSNTESPQLLAAEQLRDDTTRTLQEQLAEQELKIKALNEALKEKDQALRITEEDLPETREAASPYLQRRLVELDALLESRFEELQKASEREQKLRDELKVQTASDGGRIKELESIVESQQRQLRTTTLKNGTDASDTQEHMQQPRKEGAETRKETLADLAYTPDEQSEAESAAQSRIDELTTMVERQKEQLQIANNREAAMKKELCKGPERIQELYSTIETQSRKVGALEHEATLQTTTSVEAERKNNELNARIKVLEEIIQQQSAELLSHTGGGLVEIASGDGEYAETVSGRSDPVVADRTETLKLRAAMRVAEQNERSTQHELEHLRVQVHLSEQRSHDHALDESEIKNLKMDLEALREQLRETEEENMQLHAKIDDLMASDSAKREWHMSKVSDMHQEAEKLRSDLDAKLAEHKLVSEAAMMEKEKVRNEIKQANEASEILKQKTMFSEKVCGRQVNDIMNLREGLRTLTEQLEATQTELSKKTRELQARRQENLRLKKARSEEKTEAENLLGLLKADYEDALHRETTAKIEAEHTLHLTEHQLHISKEKIEDSEQLLNEKAKDLENKTAELAAVNGELNVATLAERTKEKELESLKAELEGVKQELADTSDAKNNVQMKLAIEEITLNQQTVGSSEERKRCDIIQQEHDERATCSAAVVSHLRLQLDAARTQQAATSAALDEAAAEHARTSEELSAKRNEVMELQDESTAKKEELNTMRSELESLSSLHDTIAEAQQESEAFKNRAKELEERQAHMSDAFNRLKVDLLSQQARNKLLGKYWSVLHSYRCPSRVLLDEEHVVDCQWTTIITGGHVYRTVHEVEPSDEEKQELQIQQMQTISKSSTCLASEESHSVQVVDPPNPVDPPSPPRELLVQEGALGVAKPAAVLQEQSSQLASLVAESSAQEPRGIELVSSSLTLISHTPTRVVEEDFEETPMTALAKVLSEEEHEVALVSEQHMTVSSCEDTVDNHHAIEHLQSRVLQLEKEMAEQEATASRQKDELASYESSAQEESSRLENLRSDLELAEQRKKSLETQLELSQNENNLLDDNLREKKEALSIVQDRLAEQDKLLHQKCESNTALEDKVEELCAAIAQDEEELKTLRQHASLEEDLKKAREAQEFLGKQLVEAQDDATAAKRRLALEHDRRTNAETELRETKQQLEELSGIQDMLHEEAAMRIEASHKQELADEQLATAQQQVDELQKEVNTAKVMIHADLQEQLNHAKEAIAAAEEKLSAAKEQQGDLEKLLRNKEDALAAKDELLESKQRELSTKKQELKQLSAKAGEKEGELMKLHEEAEEEQTKTLQQQQYEIQELLKTSAELRDALADLRQDKNATEEQVDKLKQEMEASLMKQGEYHKQLQEAHARSGAQLVASSCFLQRHEEQLPVKDAHPGIHDSLFEKLEEQLEKMRESQQTKAEPEPEPQPEPEPEPQPKPETKTKSKIEPLEEEEVVQLVSIGVGTDVLMADQEIAEGDNTSKKESASGHDDGSSERRSETSREDAGSVEVFRPINLISTSSTLSTLRGPTKELEHHEHTLITCAPPTPLQGSTAILRTPVARPLVLERASAFDRIVSIGTNTNPATELDDFVSLEKDLAVSLQRIGSLEETNEVLQKTADAHDKVVEELKEQKDTLEQQLRKACLKNVDVENKIFNANSRLQEVLNKAEADKVQLAKQKEDFERNLAKDNEYNETLVQELAAANEKIKKCEENLKVAIQQRSQLEGQAAGAKAEILGLEARVQQSAAEADQLRGKLSVTEQDLHAHGVELTKLYEEEAALKQKIEALNGEVQEEQKAGNVVEAELRAAEEKIVTLQNELRDAQKVEGEYSILVKKEAKLLEEVQDLQNRVRATEEVRSEEQESSTAFQQELRSCQAKLEITEETLTEKINEAAESERKASRLLELIEVQNTECEKTREELEAVTSALDDKNTDYSNMQLVEEGLRIANAELQKSITEQEEEAQEQRKVMDALKTAVMTLEEDAAAAEERVAEAEEQAANSNFKVADLLEVVSAAEEAAQGQTVLTAELEKQLVACSAICTELAAERDTLQAAADEGSQSLSSLKKQQSEVAEREHNLQEELAASNAELLGAKRRMQEQEEHLTSSIELLENKLNEAFIMNSAIEDLERENEGHIHALETVREELEAKTEELKRVQEQVSKSEKILSEQRERADMLETEKAAVNSQMEEKSREYDTMKRCNEDATQKLTNTEKHVVELTAKLENDSSRLLTLEQQYEEAAFQARALQEQLKEKSSELERVCRELSFATSSPLREIHQALPDKPSELMMLLQEDDDLMSTPARNL